MGLTHMAQCVPHWRATGGPLWFRFHGLSGKFQLPDEDLKIFCNV